MLSLFMCFLAKNTFSVTLWWFLYCKSKVQCTEVLYLYNMYSTFQNMCPRSTYVISPIDDIVLRNST